MKVQSNFLAAVAFFFLFVLPTQNLAADTGVGLQIEFVGGPCFAVVVENHFSRMAGVRFSVGGFPGIILRAESEVRFSAPRRRAAVFLVGAGYNRFFRGRANGKGLTEFHLGGGYRWTLKEKFRIGLNGGLLYAPTVLNPWFKETFKEEGDLLPVVPFVGIETLWNLR